MSPHSATDLAQTNRIFEEEVIGERDFSALERVYTRDCRVMPPGAEMIVGIDQAKIFWQAAAAGMAVTSLKLSTVEVEFLGSTAIEIGRASIAVEQGASFDVKYVVVWKQEDGAWKWHIDIWSPVS